ncbi:hypothetical protein K438DRAFT_1962797 [Mycena galopus ATCC 62051]|nr:hypothetical protein K438DRAFT_1962797 [Mycena galopus ATCC 62051]
MPLLPAAMHTLQEDEIQEPLNTSLNINLGEGLCCNKLRLDASLCSLGCICLAAVLLNASPLLCLILWLCSNRVLMRPTDSLPPPFDWHPRPNDTPQDGPGSDWATFITAYACGRWDPHSIPRPPRAFLPQETAPAPVPKGALAFERIVPPLPPPHRLRASFSTVSSTTPSPAASTSSTYPPFALPGSYPFPTTPNVSTSTTTGLLDAATSAATLRWAGSRVRVAPLTLPSPEHELTDPMRGASAVPIPGSHPELPGAASTSNTPPINTSGWGAYGGGVQTPGWDVMTPGGTRRSRLSGFWSGTADVDSDSGGYTYSYSSYFGSGAAAGMLPTIDGSPATPDRERGQPASVPVSAETTATASAPGSVLAGVPRHGGVFPLPLSLPRRPPPATAPMRVGPLLDGPGEEGDYFGVAVAAAAARGERQQSGRSSSGLRTPPQTREGSASGSRSPERERSRSRERTESQSPMEENDRDQDKTSPPFSAGPTTPDSNPKRPQVGRAASGPAASTSSGDSSPLRSSSETVVLINTVDGVTADPETGREIEDTSPSSIIDPDPPNAFASNSPLTHESAHEAVNIGARPMLPHASTLDHPSAHAFSASNTGYTSTANASGYTAVGDPFMDVAYAFSVQSVPVRAAPRRPVPSRQMSAPLPKSSAEVLGTLAPSTPSRARALSSDPGRNVLASHASRSSAELGALENGVVVTNANASPETDPDATSTPRRPPTATSNPKTAVPAPRGAARARNGRNGRLRHFNILGTGADLNFDRIAHLAKLVFNTKGVVISVVDGEEEWFKSEWGLNSVSGNVGSNLKAHSLARATSFCGHAILQRGDEPMIVLDSRLDWRFAKNPLVLGTPNIRFYAGAPLRTQDGFNIGCLALVDDAPREDFTPRQRHTLKEFAAIAMREMELWRDKIQLRIRDRIQNSMEQFSRECLEFDSEAAGQGQSHPPHKGDSSKTDPNANHNVLRSPNHADAPPPPPHPNDDAPKNGPARDPPDLMGPSSSMDTVYDRAAKLVQRTLDVEGVVVMDVSHCEVIEAMSAEGTVSVVLHHGDPDVPTSTHTLSAEEYARLYEFFARYPEGKISEGIVPPPLRVFLPMAHIQYALVVPIYNIDKRPFALLCAWNASDQSTRFLEGHELSYLRAIGVIILSAVLKRRMMLADKAKSLFISNISHELRTPLHGILAAAELLGDSPLNHSQQSFLETVQACGTSLVETVNHVLDFTKLSGNSKAGGVENVIVLTKVDLMQLIEEARVFPPEELSAAKQLVETVVDIGWRKRWGWSLKCEKGGIRRVLMNVFGNSLKFTTNGYVHVILRELPRSGDEAPNETKVELVVLDTGKREFPQEPTFSPLLTRKPVADGHWARAAIVNSIVKSESVNGKLDVWSEEGFGTEIKVTFTAQIASDEATAPEMEPFKFDDPIHPATVSLVGFEDEHKGVQLLHTVLQTYLVSWWGFEIRAPDQAYGEIVILNEDVEPVKKATVERNTSRPFLILSTLRGNPGVMAIASEHERIGGFCRIIYNLGALAAVRAAQALSTCDQDWALGRVVATSRARAGGTCAAMTHVSRRNSEETKNVWALRSRPKLSPRSSTAHPLTTLSWQTLSSTAEKEELPVEEDGELDPTINIGPGGTLLRSSMGTINSEERRFRVLVVEDNSILRNLLVKWLTTRGYDYRDAVDGRNGVKVYEEEGPFDVVLLDMSMPVLDGIGATTEIRQMEARRKVEDPNGRPTRILALTGMSSLEDKRRAFEAGVDGYLLRSRP